MKLILPEVIITDPRSPHNGEQKDILIKDGQITAITKISKKKKDIKYLNRFVVDG